MEYIPVIHYAMWSNENVDLYYDLELVPGTEHVYQDNVR